MAAQQQRKRHNGILVLAIIIAIVAIITGGLMIHHHNDQQQMQEIVHSKEAKKVFDDDMRGLDSKAFTPEGVIQSYTIDDSTIRHDPMGGIMVTLYANGDHDLDVEITLIKHIDADTGEYGSLQGGAGSCSAKLDDMLAAHGEGPSMKTPKE